MYSLIVCQCRTDGTPSARHFVSFWNSFSRESSLPAAFPAVIPPFYQPLTRKPGEMELTAGLFFATMSTNGYSPGRLAAPCPHQCGAVRQSPPGRHPAPKVVVPAAFRCLFLFAPVRDFFRRISDIKCSYEERQYRKRIYHPRPAQRKL